MPKLEHLELHAMNSLKEAIENLLRLVGGTVLRSVVVYLNSFDLSGRQLADLLQTVLKQPIMSKWLELRCNSVKFSFELMEIISSHLFTFTIGRCTASDGKRLSCCYLHPVKLGPETVKEIRLIFNDDQEESDDDDTTQYGLPGMGT